MKKKLLALLCAVSLLTISGCSGSTDSPRMPDFLNGSSSAAPASSSAPVISSAPASHSSSTASSSAPAPQPGPDAPSTTMSVDNNGSLTIDRGARKNTPMGPKGTWTFFVYLCGSDLESVGGAGTSDLLEMVGADTGNNVKFVVQTGGSYSWDNVTINADRLQRYVIQNGSMSLVNEAPLSSMGDKKTLEEFVSWGVRNFPAEKMCLILWNHGGGSLSGVCMDELFGRDSLSLPEIDEALSAAGAGMTDQFELIGFDACLMGSIETANVCANYARYMIASEETESGLGWNYDKMAKYAKDNPSASGKELGKAVCDNYIETYEKYCIDTLETLALYDLTKLDALIVKLNAYTRDLYDATEDNANLAAFCRNVLAADNFGGNNMIEGYTNMVDLGGIINAGKDIVSGANGVLSALSDVVAYHRSGTTHSGAYGLSTYYPLEDYDGSADLSRFADVAVSPYYLALVTRKAYATVNEGNYYDYDLGGLFDFWSEFWGGFGSEFDSYWGDYWDYFDDYDPDDIGDSKYISFKEEPHIDDDGYYCFTLSDEALQYTESVEAAVYMVYDDDIIELGRSADIVYNWSTGYVSDNFDGYWYSLPDGQILNIYVVSQCDGYDIYTAPIILNGKQTNLRFIDYYTDGIITIEGVWDGIDEDGMAARNITKLKKGDVITPLYSSLWDDEDYSYWGDEYIYDGFSGLEFCMLPDTDYYYYFIIYDLFGNFYLTESADFSIIDGEVYY